MAKYKVAGTLKSTCLHMCIVSASCLSLTTPIRSIVTNAVHGIKVHESMF